jgi:hypothetical protein
MGANGSRSQQSSAIPFAQCCLLGRVDPGTEPTSAIGSELCITAHMMFDVHISLLSPFGCCGYLTVATTKAEYASIVG